MDKTRLARVLTLILVGALALVGCGRIQVSVETPTPNAVATQAAQDVGVEKAVVATPTAMAPTPTPVPATATVTKALAVAPLTSATCTTEHRFSSGGACELEEFTVTLRKSCFRPGENVILLENANKPYSRHWVIWDSLHLKDAAGDIIWQLGNNDAPPDYSDTAFSEFKQDPPPYNTDYNVATMPVNQFPKEINDGDFPQVFIHFNLTPDQIQGDLTLFLDTLYARHDQVTRFDMRIAVNP